MRKKSIPPKKLHAYVRAGIQLLFFLFLPSAFTTAFSGIKALLTQIGSSSPIAWSSFLTVLLALCAYTIVFGRFFCGYACAFGSLGDAVRGLYLWICKKCKKKPHSIPKAVCRWLSYGKYVVLLAIVLLCFSGVYGKLSGWSPWDVFSMLHAGNFHLSGYVLGVVLLVLIVAGMVFCNRFFCRFLCPMGAVFSLLPVLPLFSVHGNGRVASRAAALVSAAVRLTSNCRRLTVGTAMVTASSARNVWIFARRKTPAAEEASSVVTRSGLLY